MTEQQSAEVVTLRDACLHAEDALWQGMERLQQTLAETVAASQLIEGSYIQMDAAMEKLDALVTFVNEVCLHFLVDTLNASIQILTCSVTDT